MKRRAVAVVLLSSISVLPVQAQGDIPSTRATLRGLPGVYVSVDSISADARSDGLFASQIQTDVELRLREAGIRVLTFDEAGATRGSGSLWVEVSTVHPLQALYGYSIGLNFTQGVRLERNGLYTAAATWSALGVLGTVDGGRLSETVRKSVRDLVDQFINAYLSVNPRR